MGLGGDEGAIRRGIAEVVAEVGDHPATLGFYIKDEPSAEEFTGLRIAVDEVQRIYHDHHRATVLPGVLPT